MPEEKLNLLQFASGRVTQLRARTPKVMGSNPHILSREIAF
jgi:hypothetical protein